MISSQTCASRFGKAHSALDPSIVYDNVRTAPRIDSIHHLIDFQWIAHISVEEMRFGRSTFPRIASIAAAASWQIAKPCTPIRAPTEANACPIAMPMP